MEVVTRTPIGKETAAGEQASMHMGVDALILQPPAAIGE
jgi:hypothetical protein